MDGDELADLLGGRCACIRGGLDRADVAAHHDGDEAAADLLLADELDVRGLHHGVRGFDGGDKAARFDHSKGIRVDIHCWFLRLS